MFKRRACGFETEVLVRLGAVAFCGCRIESTGTDIYSASRMLVSVFAIKYNLPTDPTQIKICTPSDLFYQNTRLRSSTKTSLLPRMFAPEPVGLGVGAVVGASIKQVLVPTKAPSS